MSKTFRGWDVDQSWLLPPSVHEFVPADHVAHLIRDTVREGLDLSAITSTYTEERGYPPFHPGMMVALLLYGYSRGVYSSRQLQRACQERVDFMAVTGLNKPDFRTIAAFRARHLVALQALFGQVLALCAKAGLVQLGHVALDGTKIRANASRHKAMSYGRMGTAAAALEERIKEWFVQAAAIDASEDRTYGPDRDDVPVPDWMSDTVQRLARIRRAKAELEAEAKAMQAASRQSNKTEKGSPPEDDDGPGPSSGMRERGKTHPCAEGVPPSQAQRNFTDPDSRIQPSKNEGFIAGYNAPIAVDAANQIIVSQRLSTNPTDFGALIPLIDAAYQSLGQSPTEVSGDSGFASEANLLAMDERGIEPYLAPGRSKHGNDHDGGERDFKSRPRMKAMAETLKQQGRQSPYRLRKQVVEPVFGQIKQARGFRQFLLRGLNKVKAEWSIICTAHNLLKLVGADAKAKAAA
jgi:transposase